MGYKTENIKENKQDNQTKIQQYGDYHRERGKGEK